MERLPRLLALSAAAALTCAVPARSLSTPGDSRPKADRSADDPARETRRVLRLANGQSIRVVARLEAGTWHYRAAAGWRELDAAFVVSSVPESDLLREWRRRTAALEKHDLDQQVGLAAWALEQGLLREGLEELDGVLAVDRGHRAARELLARETWLAVPSLEVDEAELTAARRELLRWGASMPPAAREMAVNELEKVKEDEGLRDELLAELRSNIVARRSFGALALGRVLPGEGLKPLLMHAILDPSTDVRLASAHALTALGEPGVVVPVVRALESSDVRVRENAAQALGEMGYAQAVPALMAALARAASPQVTSSGRLPHSHIFVGRQIAYIQDFDVEVAQFQAVADPQVNVLVEGQVTEAAVHGELVQRSLTEAPTIRMALKRLTGEDRGSTSRAWLAWWEANRERWMAGLTAPATGDAR